MWKYQRGTWTPNRRIYAECSNHLSYQGHTFAAPYFYTSFGGIDIFELKLTFEMVIVHEQHHSFSTHEAMFLWKRQRFESRNVSTWGGLQLPPVGFIANALTICAIRANQLLSHIF